MILLLVVVIVTSDGAELRFDRAFRMTFSTRNPNSTKKLTILLAALIGSEIATRTTASLWNARCSRMNVAQSVRSRARRNPRAMVEKSN